MTTIDSIRYVYDVHSGWIINVALIILSWFIERTVFPFHADIFLSYYNQYKTVTPEKKKIMTFQLTDPGFITRFILPMFFMCGFMIEKAIFGKCSFFLGTSAGRLFVYQTMMWSVITLIYKIHIRTPKTISHISNIKNKLAKYYLEEINFRSYVNLFFMILFTCMLSFLKSYGAFSDQG